MLYLARHVKWCELLWCFMYISAQCVSGSHCSLAEDASSNEALSPDGSSLCSTCYSSWFSECVRWLLYQLHCSGECTVWNTWQHISADDYLFSSRRGKSALRWCLLQFFKFQLWSMLRMVCFIVRPPALVYLSQFYSAIGEQRQVDLTLHLPADCAELANETRSKKDNFLLVLTQRVRRCTMLYSAWTSNFCGVLGFGQRKYNY